MFSTATVEASNDLQPTSGLQNLEELLGRLPGNFHIKFSADKIIVREDWFKWRCVWLTLAITALVFFNLEAINALPRNAQHVIQHGDSRSLIVLGVVAAVALAIVYSVLAGLLNTTTIKVSNRTVSRSIGPLPWLGGFSLDHSEIDQFYAAARMFTQRSKTSLDWNSNLVLDRRRDRNKVLLRSLKPYCQVSRYRLMVCTKCGKRYAVTNSYWTTAIPQTVECALEALLGISDRHVSGESRRRRSLG